MIRRLFLAALFAALGMSAHADTVTFFEAYDVSSTSLIYCKFIPPRTGQGFITTTGSSTTWTAVGAATPFLGLAAGDELTVIPGMTGTPIVRYIQTATSSTSIVVAGSAADLSNGGAGYAFTYRTRSCGTASTDGWVDVGSLGGRPLTLQIIVATINATSLTWSLEGRVAGRNTTATTIVPEIVYTGTGSQFITITEGVSAIRLGIKINTDGGAQSVSAYLSEPTK